MKGIPELTVEEARELGFKIDLKPGTEGECRVRVRVTAPESLDGRKYTGMNYALYRGSELLLFSNGISDNNYRLLIADELLSTLVVLPVYSDDRLGYAYQILFTDVEWDCEQDQSRKKPES